jgi:hypothetical protein
MDADVHTVIDLGRRFFAHRSVGVAEGHLGHIRLPRGDGGNDFPIAVELDSVGSNMEVFLAGDSMGNGFLGFVQCFDLPSFSPDLLKVIEVAIRDRGNVFATKHSDFKVARLLQTVLLRDLSASAFQIIEGLKDDTFSANMFGNAIGVSIMRNQFLRGSKIDTVNMGVPAA